MPHKTFTYAFAGSAEAFISHVRAEIAKAKGTLDGNAQSGSFDIRSMAGTIAGSYAIQGDSISITITKKPLLVSDDRIQRELESLFAKFNQAGA